ncbi:MAG: hypothetical protein KBD53_08570 [Candidatus Omnitrophica bacterium]|nr:hypothetical protein [Candidatus Omnitrophota bacterium]
MNKIIVLISFLLISPRLVWAQSTTLAVLQQTITQTAEHLQSLQKAVQQIQLLQQQVQDTQDILQLAQNAAEGSDGVAFISDFRNIVTETNDLIEQIQGYVDKDQNLSEEWTGVFGSLDNWVDHSGEFFESIEMSDSINSRGYAIADNYQEAYQQNARNAQALIDHAKIVNEKGAVKQIAEEMGHLIEMENNSVYLLSEMLRGQSVEYSNTNLKRKEEIIQFEKENKGVQRFMSLATSNAFDL